jgi:hypothetical protein
VGSGTWVTLFEILEVVGDRNKECERGEETAPHGRKADIH